jgi:hypothetical protein
MILLETKKLDLENCKPNFPQQGYNICRGGYSRKYVSSEGGTGWYHLGAKMWKGNRKKTEEKVLRENQSDKDKIIAKRTIKANRARVG